MLGLRLILASRSPQRRAILEQIGLEFEVCPADVEELEVGDPAEVALENARRKAVAVAGTASDRRVLGVDTVVAVGEKIYGKPADVREARATLDALSGRWHRVIGGLCLLDAQPIAGATGTARMRTATATTMVEFRRLDQATIEWYLASREWRERAGGYAIQGRGAALVKGIEGDYLNVVGLPLVALLELEPGLLRQAPPAG